MNWKLIFLLSLFGLAMGIATVFVIPPTIEPGFWLVIFAICAYLLARRRPGLLFPHGLLIGLVNSVWITAAHVIFFDRYLAGHPREAAMMQSPTLPTSPKMMMVLVGPIVGLLSGIILGLFAMLAGKLVRSRPSHPVAA